MRFLVNVSAWVRWMASPKQPQSIFGLKTTSSRVISVNRLWKPIDTGATTLLHTPVISPAPIVHSANEKNIPAVMAEKSMNPICRKWKYSFITREAPTGSISFRMPEMKNTKPATYPQNLFIRRRKYLIFTVL